MCGLAGSTAVVARAERMGLGQEPLNIETLRHDAEVWPGCKRTLADQIVKRGLALIEDGETSDGLNVLKEARRFIVETHPTGMSDKMRECLTALEEDISEAETRLGIAT